MTIKTKSGLDLDVDLTISKFGALVYRDDAKVYTRRELDRRIALWVEQMVKAAGL